MEVVADASALLAVVLDEPERDVIIEATEDAVLTAPEALPFEIGNALTAMRKRRRIEEEAVLPAWEAIQKIPVRLISIDVGAAISLALAHGLYAYDAYYLHCALALRRPLLTLDRGMRATAKDLGIQLSI